MVNTFFELSMAEIEVLAPGGNQDSVKMSSVKKCFVYVLGDLGEH